MWHFKSTRCSTSYIPPRTEEAGAALHMLGTLRWSYNAQKLFCIVLFLKILVCVFLDEIHHPGARFRLLVSAWRFERNENGSCLARKWCIRAGIEPNATIGQLVKMWTPTGCGATNIWHKQRSAVPLGVATYGQNVVVGSSVSCNLISDEFHWTLLQPDLTDQLNNNPCDHLNPVSFWATDVILFSTTNLRTCTVFIHIKPLAHAYLDESLRKENLNGFFQQRQQAGVMDTDSFFQQWQQMLHLSKTRTG